MNERSSPASLPTLPSNQNFGWIFTGIFALIGAYSAWIERTSLAVTLFALSGLFAALTLLAPRALTPLNRLWFKFGLLLGRIVSPLVLAVLFFLVITPVALLTRLFGRDELRLKRRDKSTYWISREPPGPDRQSFKNQY
ncbi:MAG: hypothetical protein GTO41_14600 [Burkholderiales bacterium]|nr:hypothetical protein [Burkholderiales bacterium]